MVGVMLSMRRSSMGLTATLGGGSKRGEEKKLGISWTNLLLFQSVDVLFGAFLRSSRSDPREGNPGPQIFSAGVTQEWLVTIPCYSRASVQLTQVFIKVNFEHQFSKSDPTANRILGIVHGMSDNW